MFTPNRIKEFLLSNPAVSDVSIEIQGDKWVINCVADDAMVRRIENQKIKYHH